MKKLVICLVLLSGALTLPLIAQTEYMLYDTTASDTFEFWMRTPVGYDSTRPPAILVWWHGYGANSLELRDGTDFDTLCGQRGWIAASFRGPYDGKHYQCRRGQHQADSMLTWAMSTAPFSMDSIYMAGSSMGAAAGQVWHNNHCGIHDFMAAAVVGGSPILDCELRQKQYVNNGHTLDAMRAVFGGFPWDSDSIRHEYHRASAVRLADTSETMDNPDTTESMHFNALHLPVYNTWGTTDNCWSCEWYAYGRPAQKLDTLRRFDHADTTMTFCSGIDGHGYNVLRDDSVVMWLSSFRVNRFPADISINADEDDEYYWTRVRLDTQRFVMGRYGVKRSFDDRRLDINLVRNVASLEVEFAFPWPQFDSLSGTWMNFDSAHVQQVQILLTGVPAVRSVKGPDGAALPFNYHADTLSLSLRHSGNHTVYFGPQGADDRHAGKPTKWRLISAYPNPFNSQIALELESPLAVKQEIRLYDITGRIAKTLTASLSPGVQRVMISGEGLSSGIYFVAFPNSEQAPVKIVLLK